jgi:hypothetical protein
MSDTLKRLADQYPALTPSAVLKTALLSLGVRHDPILVKAAEWALPDFRPYTMSDGTQVQIPYLMILEGGSLVRLRCRNDSPFTIAHHEGAFRILDGQNPMVSFNFAKRPAWHDRTAEDGTPLVACGLNQHGDMMVLNLTPACEYWTTPFEGRGFVTKGKATSYRCAFCGYGLPDERSKSLGQEPGNPAIPRRVLAHGAEAVRIGKDSGAKHLYLTGGSMTDPKKEADRYLHILEGVREASKGIYLTVGSQALPPDRLQGLKQAGADGICFNLEVWDRGVWERVCPGKSRFFGRKMWEDSLLEGVGVFGRGNVHTAFVIGAEMVLDETLSDPEAALSSNLEGVEWLLSRGINPILSLFWPFVGTELEGAAGPDLHFLLRLYSAVFEMRRQLNMPFPNNLACKRCLYMQVEGDFSE